MCQQYCMHIVDWIRTINRDLAILFSIHPLSINESLVANERRVSKAKLMKTVEQRYKRSTTEVKHTAFAFTVVLAILYSVQGLVRVDCLFR